LDQIHLRPHLFYTTFKCSFFFSANNIYTIHYFWETWNFAKYLNFQ